MSVRNRICILLCLTLAVFIGVFSFPRIAQDPQYHMFADNRAFIKIPNFFNVISNLPFLLAGIWGLTHLFQRKNAAAFREEHERLPYAIFFLGYALTFLGSSYYHWSPENSTLMWDRLPMAIVCMAIVAATLNDRIGHRVGTFGLYPMLVLGIVSVVYWYLSELRGSGDLRLYGIVQFFSLAAIVLLILLFPARYTHSGWLLTGGGTYIIAKLLETFDRQVFFFTGVSGHTLKHLVASLAAFCILQMLGKRKPVDQLI